MRKLINLVESAAYTPSFKQRLMTESMFDDPYIKWPLVAISAEAAGILVAKWFTCDISVVFPVVGAVALAVFLGIEFLKTRNLLETGMTDQELDALKSYGPASIAVSVYQKNKKATINDYARELTSMIERGIIEEGSKMHDDIKKFNTTMFMENIFAAKNETMIKDKYPDIYQEVKRLDREYDISLTSNQSHAAKY